MKKKVSTTTKPLVLECYYDKHDFFQVGEGHNYAVQTLGGLNVPSNKPPRFICRQCGKVIQLP